MQQHPTAAHFGATPEGEIKSFTPGAQYEGVKIDALQDPFAIIAPEVPVALESTAPFYIAGAEEAKSAPPSFGND